MIRVTIINPDGSQYGWIDLADQDAVDSWTAECQSSGSLWVQLGCSLQQTDISPQVLQQDLIQKGLKAQQDGATVIAAVYAINDPKLASGAMSLSDFQAMLSDTTLQQIERLLKNGSIGTAKAMISSIASTTTYFTSDEINQILGLITSLGY
jgi:hypothetical protein